MTHFLEALLTLIVLFGSLATMLWGMLKFGLKDIHNDLLMIKNDINQIRIDVSDLKQGQLRSEQRIDHLYEENNRLYKILIDLVQKK